MVATALVSPAFTKRASSVAHWCKIRDRGRPQICTVSEFGLENSTNAGNAGEQSKEQRAKSKEPCLQKVQAVQAVQARRNIAASYVLRWESSRALARRFFDRSMLTHQGLNDLTISGARELFFFSFFLSFFPFRATPFFAFPTAKRRLPNPESVERQHAA